MECDAAPGWGILSRRFIVTVVVRAAVRAPRLILMSELRASTRIAEWERAVARAKPSTCGCLNPLAAGKSTLERASPGPLDNSLATNAREACWALSPLLIQVPETTSSSPRYTAARFGRLAAALGRGPTELIKILDRPPPVAPKSRKH